MILGWGYLPALGKAMGEGRRRIWQTMDREREAYVLCVFRPMTDNWGSLAMRPKGDC